MSHRTSPYDPPRARWYSGVWYAWHRLLHAEGVAPVLPFTTLRFLVSSVVPGLAFGMAGRRILACLTSLGYLSCFLLLAIRLGHPEASIAFGMLISIHASSVLFAIERSMPGPMALFERLSYTIGVVIIMGAIVYFPLRQYVMHHLALPVSIKGEIIVVRPSREAVNRGDWVVYQMHPKASSGVRIQGGIAYARLIGMGGDHLRFTPYYVMVNEAIPDQLQPNMPQQGESVVKEKHWFIWPDLEFPARGENRDLVTDIKMQVAEVPESEVIGKPFIRWFGRRQQLP